MLPQKTTLRDAEICFKNGFALPIDQENRVFHLKYSKWLEKKAVSGIPVNYRVSLTQGEIHSETEVEGEGENSKAMELLWSNTLKIMERFCVAPVFVPPCRKHNIN